jgi:hypothetical protein
MTLGILNQHYSDEIKKLAVWAKGRIVPPSLQHTYDPTVWRYDDLGNPIKYDEYGNRSSPYGWEYDHHPVAAALGGTDDISNLRPLHCIANASHGGVLGSLINNSR